MNWTGTAGKVLIAGAAVTALALALPVNRPAPLQPEPAAPTALPVPAVRTRTRSRKARRGIRNRLQGWGTFAGEIGVTKGSVSTVLLVVALVIGWLTIAPSTFGGPATYVRIKGESMLPTIEPGSMVMLRKKDEYAMGDVIAFRAKTMNDAVLIHRVTGRDETGTRFVTQGDNTAFEDAYRPLPEDVLGAMVFEIPQGGQFSGFVQSPIGFSVLSGLAAASVVLGGQTRRRRRNRSYSY